MRQSSMITTDSLQTLCLFRIAGFSEKKKAASRESSSPLLKMAVDYFTSSKSTSVTLPSGFPELDCCGPWPASAPGCCWVA